jgi:hypothetical protein
MRLARALWVTALPAVFAAPAGAVPLPSVQLVEHPAKASPAGLGADGPKAVMYFKNGSSAPSCGLLPRGGSEIAPLLEPDGDENFPQCSGVIGAVRFRWAGQTVYVVRFLQRDTSEDTTDSDVALSTGPAGLARPDGVDQGAMPNHKPLGTVAAWVKAQLVGAGDIKAGFQPSERDLALTDGAFLAVSVDAAGARCRLTPGAVALDAMPTPIVVPCSGVLATTGFSSGATAWFVVLVKTPDGHTAAHAFSASAKTAGPAPELDAKLATTAAGGKILPVRDALKKLVAGR